MEGVTHRFVQTNGIKMHVAEQGSGPAVLLLHGFPSLWYMWRHQMKALADAGYHAIAPDQRGYGQTDVPAGEDEYTVFHMVGDLIGLLDALGEHKPVLVVGHDWGSPIGMYLCQFRPDRVKAFVAVAVSCLPRFPGEIDWVQKWTGELGEGFYIARFQEPGRAERDFASVGTAATLKAFQCGFWDVRKGSPTQRMCAPEGKELSSAFLKEELPPWYTEADLKYCVANFEKTGFTGALNWYRNFGRDWKLTAPWVNCPNTTRPVYYISGEYCAVNKFPNMENFVENHFKQCVPNLRGIAHIKEAAHFVPEEQPEAFNEKLLAFFAELQNEA